MTSPTTSSPPQSKPLEPSLLLNLPDNLRIWERELEIRKARQRLRTYQPYPKQAEFHAAGALYRERLFLAGNRVGKTQSGGAEAAIHLSGRYPDWWEGKRFTKPIRAWAAGVTGLSTRDVVQAKLLGPPDNRAEWGTGFIPHDCLDLGKIATGRGIPGAIDMCPVRHHDANGRFDGYSSLAFKSYEMGREKWQGSALELLWYDEEPDLDIYTEGLTRTNETGGIVYLTCTPLKGMSRVMKRFLMPFQADEENAAAS